MAAMEQWGTLQYLQAGAYIAIMLAVLGVPQMLSSYSTSERADMQRSGSGKNAARNDVRMKIDADRRLKQRSVATMK